MLQFHNGALQEEVRLRAFIESEPAFSETAASLSMKLNVHRRVARRVLDRYVDMHVVQRRTFGARIEPVYYRYMMKAS
jgi:hypothetical protein